MKKGFCFYNTLCLSALLMTSASAYIDPSVTTYAIQIIAGVAVALGAAVGILWRRAKKSAQEKLGIDLDRKKEVEEDVVSFEGPDDPDQDLKN